MQSQAAVREDGPFRRAGRKAPNPARVPARALRRRNSIVRKLNLLFGLS